MKKATVTHIIKNNTTLMADQQAKVVGTKGYGGIIENGETWQENAVREVGEETGGSKEKRINPDEEGGITIYADKLEPVAVIDFYNGEDVPFGEPSIRVLFCRTFDFNRKAIDTVEMLNPYWYDNDHLPFEKMIKGDDLIVPSVLAGIPIKGWVRRTKDWMTVIEYEIKPCSVEDLVI